MMLSNATRGGGLAFNYGIPLRDTNAEQLMVSVLRSRSDLFMQIRRPRVLQSIAANSDNLRQRHITTTSHSRMAGQCINLDWLKTIRPSALDH